MTSPFPPSGNEGYIRNRDVFFHRNTKTKIKKILSSQQARLQNGPRVLREPQPAGLTSEWLAGLSEQRPANLTDEWPAGRTDTQPADLIEDRPAGLSESRPAGLTS